MQSGKWQPTSCPCLVSPHSLHVGKSGQGEDRAKLLDHILLQLDIFLPGPGKCTGRLQSFISPMQLPLRGQLRERFIIKKKEKKLTNVSFR